MKQSRLQEVLTELGHQRGDLADGIGENVGDRAKLAGQNNGKDGHVGCSGHNSVDGDWDGRVHTGSGANSSARDARDVKTDAGGSIDGRGGGECCECHSGEGDDGGERGHYGKKFKECG